jgi:hypothetical protein
MIIIIENGGLGNQLFQYFFCKSIASKNEKIYLLGFDDLKKLMDKYKEKQVRYEQLMNEATIRNERIILNIHLEQVRRFRETHLKAFRETNMDTTD